MANPKEKEMTLEDLAIMVGQGFNSMAETMGNGFGRLEGRMDNLEKDVTELKTDVTTLKTDTSGLRSGVNNYLKLSDKRYLEIKGREKVITGWVKIIGDKTGIKIDLAELEKVF